MAYETLLVFGVLAVAFILPHILIGVFVHRSAAPVLLWTHLFVVLLVYFVGCWSRLGQTLAMKTWKIRLETVNGSRPHPVQLLRRYLLCWPSLAICGFGLAWALFDPDRQFLHDRLAGTRLVVD